MYAQGIDHGCLLKTQFLLLAKDEDKGVTLKNDVYVRGK